MEQNEDGIRSFTLEMMDKKKDIDTVIELGGILDTQSLLFGGDTTQKLYINTLSAREMKSLTSLCDTLLPSIHLNNFSDHQDNSVASFYRTSASMTGTPERLGGLISGRLKHPKVWLMRLALWLLSTWLGTVILCGPASFSGEFPYVHSFCNLSEKKRQEIMVSWSLGFLYHMRMFIKTIKLLTLLVFFTQVDQTDDNPSWKAIGYSGPDTKFKTQIEKQISYGEPKDEEQEEKDGYMEEHFGPLYRRLVNLNYARDIAADTLRRFGFPVSVLQRKTNAPSMSSPSLVIKCDAVVIGSGSGGGVVAGVLANAGYKVLVLEKGSYCARNNLSLLEGPTLDQMYLSNGLIATDDMCVLVLAGSTVGGGSTINWSASIQTPQHVLKEWSNQYELELFDSKLYKEAMEVVCDKMGVQSDVNEEGFNNAVLRKGCEEMGYPVNNIPRNSPPDHYCGWCCLGCKDGRKKGTSETWLVDLVTSGNGAILPGCKAIKVLQKNKKGRTRKVASGVAFEFQYKGAKDICFVESKVTIVACGALSTPALLKESGLKNDNIGRNLHLHPVAMAWGYFPDTPSSNVWPERQKRSYEGGIMTAMSPVVADFEKSGYGAVIQTPALHPGVFSILMPWVSGADIKDRMSKFSRTAHIFALARDKGSAIVHSPNDISYQMKDDDEKNLQKGLEKVLRILAAAGAEEIGTHNCTGKTLNVKQVSLREFEKFVKEESSRPLTDLSTQLCSAHQMGSCRMGIDPKDSVVNQMGETWEVEGLFIADTSVFPTALGVNPMVTVQAISYCTAQSVLEVLRRKKSR
ncbi:Long-chain-alcohol oxidase [Quillaja saponaria]|nr:Long-chain-alcohol oxidase [Quillaja saponaria]